MAVTRTAEEIADQENEAQDQVMGGGSRWPGMSYEQGVVAALRWVTGEDDVAPMAEDD